LIDFFFLFLKERSAHNFEVMEWIGTALLLGVALAMDCLALSITDGLVYKGLKVWQAIFIAFVYALLQGLFPLAGFFLGEAFINKISPWHLLVAFALLAVIGGKMAYDGIKGFIKPEERKEGKFSIPSVLLQGVADSIDAFAVGITLTSTINAADPSSVPMWVTMWVIAIISICTFVISLLGVFLGKGINKILRGHYEVANLLGGLVLLGIGIKSLVEFFIAIA
jgi:manganese efflux pump family protein